MPRKQLQEKLNELERSVRTIYVSSYIPKPCGVATYTKDLTTAINELNPKNLAEILAVTPDGHEYEYPWEVKYRIRQKEIGDYVSAAHYINQSGAQVVHLQHEFGLFGGNVGDYIIPFLENIKKPIVTTFHSVLRKPSYEQLRIIRKIAELSDAVTVMINTVSKTLVDVYDVPKSKVAVIPHGVPDIPYGDNEHYKKELGLRGRTVFSTINLLNPNKGIEYAILAMEEVIKYDPNALYLVIGKTHPSSFEEGEQYRAHLEKLASKYKGNVKFINKYISLEELITYLRATDIYLTPYLEPENTASGALAYAVGAGKACVSTSFLYAKEVLGKERGELLPFRDPDAIAKAIVRILKNDDYKETLQSNAYAYGRQMIWSNVALKHLDLFNLIAKKK
jgi:polysaccharide biosynthesis protein PslF